MKKILFSSLAIVLFTVATNAQGFRAGIKLGANGTKIDGQSFEDGYKLSYQAGVFFAGEGAGLGFQCGGKIIDNKAQFCGHLVV